jgi:phospholipid/cholesterol/gamma-HCH transport system substrate-binding protein
MNKRATDFWVGLFVLLGFAAAAFLALKAGNLASFGTNETYTVKAKFDNIAGKKCRSYCRKSCWNWLRR